MKKYLKLSLLALALVLSISPSAHAYGGGLFPWLPLPKPPPPPPRPHGPTTAPEVDPSLAISGFALLAGTLTVVRSRRSKR
jgi:hypothetical protein